MTYAGGLGMGASVPLGGGPRNRLRYIRFGPSLNGALPLSSTSLISSIFRTVLRYPYAVFDALSAGWAVRRRGWYKRAPFLPLPPARYLRWRAETAYGDEEKGPSTLETRRYLRWAARLRGRMS